MPERPLEWFHDYSFEDGGDVETAIVEAGRLPFDISRWDVSPGQSNDLDIHRSTEVWLMAAGTGVLTLDGADSRLRAGDAVVLRSGIPHQLYNDGKEVLRAISVYWTGRTNPRFRETPPAARDSAP